MKHDDLIDISQLPQLQIVEVEHADRLSELESVVHLDPSAVEAPAKKADWAIN